MKKEEKILQVALRLVRVRPRFRAELGYKLSERGFDQNEIETVLNKLAEVKILNDDEFLSNYIQTLHQQRLWSQKRIWLKLVQLKLPKEQIEQALSNYFNQNENLAEEVAKKTALKKLKSLSKFDKNIKKQKLATYLAQKGFSWEIIKKILADLNIK